MTCWIIFSATPAEGSHMTDIATQEKKPSLGVFALPLVNEKTYFENSLHVNGSISVAFWSWTAPLKPNKKNCRPQLGVPFAGRYRRVDFSLGRRFVPRVPPSDFDGHSCHENWHARWLCWRKIHPPVSPCKWHDQLGPGPVVIRLQGHRPTPNSRRVRSIRAQGVCGAQ